MEVWQVVVSSWPIVAVVLLTALNVGKILNRLAVLEAKTTEAWKVINELIRK